MRGKNTLGALPLLLRSGNLVGLNLPLLEIRNSVYDDPRYATTEVNELHDGVTIERRATNKIHVNDLLREAGNS